MKEILIGIVSGTIVLVVGIMYSNYKEHKSDVFQTQMFLNEFNNSKVLNRQFLKKYSKFENLSFNEIMRITYEYNQLSFVDIRTYNPMQLSKLLKKYTLYLKVNNNIKTMNRLLIDFQDSCILTAIPTNEKKALLDLEHCTQKTVKFKILAEEIKDKILKDYIILEKNEPILMPRLLK